MINNKFGFLDLVSKVVFIFTAGYLARKVGPSLYAGWVLLGGIQLLISNIASLGFSTTMQRLLPAMTLLKQNFYVLISMGISFFFCLVSLFVFFIFHEEIMTLYGVPHHMGFLIYPLILNAFLICIENIYESYLKIRENFKKYKTYIIYKNFCELITLVYFFKIRIQTAGEYLLLEYISTLLALKVFGYLAFVVITFKKFKAGAADVKDLKGYIIYGLPTVLASVMLWAFGNLDKALLTRFMSPFDLGNYFFGSTLATYVSYVGVLVIPLILPRLSFLHDKSNSSSLESTSIYLNQNVTCLIFSVSCIWMILSVFAKEIILMTAGGEYLAAIEPLFFMGLYWGIDQVLGVWAFVYHLKKKPYVLTNIRLGYFVIFVGGLWLSLTLTGSKYIVFTLLVMGMFYNLILYIYAQTFIKIQMSMKNKIGLCLSLLTNILIYNISDRFDLYSKIILFCVTFISLIFLGLREFRKVDKLFYQLKIA